VCVCVVTRRPIELERGKSRPVGVHADAAAEIERRGPDDRRDIGRGHRRRPGQRVDTVLRGRHAGHDRHVRVRLSGTAGSDLQRERRVAARGRGVRGYVAAVRRVFRLPAGRAATKK